jgi:hypothetical protein
MIPSSARDSTCAAKPAGVAWVIVVVVTSPVLLPAAWARRRIGVCARPSGVKLMAPLLTLWPHPQADEAAAESVTGELAEAVSMSA